MEKRKIIEVRDLVKKYGDFTAVKGISFDVYENEIFGLLGPNGAGKSTTLEIIETLRDKTSGQVIVAGAAGGGGGGAITGGGAIGVGLCLKSIVAPAYRKRPR